MRVKKALQIHHLGAFDLNDQGIAFAQQPLAFDQGLILCIDQAVNLVGLGLNGPYRAEIGRSLDRAQHFTFANLTPFLGG